MAESLGTAVLDLRADSSQLRRELAATGTTATTASKSFGRKFATGMRKAFVPAIAVVGAAGVAAKKSVDAASDLEEQINKTGAVFGKSAPVIQKWSETTAQGIGISQREALEATGTFGNMLVPMGIARGRAADMSKSMVQLAGDMASFNNASPEETLDALRSGLAGETEPLRRFGVFLNAARVEQEAMNLGLTKGNKELTAAQKAQATYSIILKDTNDAQGDFKRTSDSAANAARIQAAEAEDLSAQIGEGLLPVYKALQGILLTVTRFMANHTEAVKVGAIAIVGLATAVIAINAAMKLYAAGLVIARVAQLALNRAVLANPYVLAAAAVLTFVTIIITQWDKIKRRTEKIWNGIKRFITRWWDKILPIVGGPLGLLVTLVIKKWDKIRDTTKRIWDVIKSFIVDPIKEAFKAVRTAVRSVVSWLRDRWNEVRGLFDNIGGKVLTAIVTPFREALGVGGKVRDLVRDAIKFVRERFVGFKETAREILNRLGRGVTEAFRGVKRAFRSVANVIKRVGNFIIKVINKVLDAVGELKDKIKDVVPDVDLPDITPWDGLSPFRLGGRVPGSGRGDRVPAALEPGEFVIRRKVAERMMPFLTRLNAMQTGGAVGGLNPAIKSIVDFAHQKHRATVTSGLRPGDTDSLHSRGAAADMVSPSMLTMARDLFGRFRSRLEELFFDPLGKFIPTQGVVQSGAIGGHGDHVHAAAFGGALANIRRNIIPPIKIKGRGPMAAMARGAASMMRNAGNAFLNSIALAAPGEPAATAGAFSKGQLQTLWSRANGGLGDPNLMAAIALAESGGNPNAVSPADDRGLWQINWPIWGSTLGRFGSPFNPLANARMAGHVLGAQGLGAWVTFNQGKHRQFLQGGGPVLPFLGSFANGGVAPRDGLAHVHEGETITSGRGRPVEFVITNWRDGRGFFREIVDRQTRQRDPVLPGRGGGRL